MVYTFAASADELQMRGERSVRLGWADLGALHEERRTRINALSPLIRILLHAYIDGAQLGRPSVISFRRKPPRSGGGAKTSGPEGIDSERRKAKVPCLRDSGVTRDEQ